MSLLKLTNYLSLIDYSIQILIALLFGEWWKIIVPEVKFNLGLLFTEARRAEVNSRPRLNFTEAVTASSRVRETVYKY